MTILESILILVVFIMIWVSLEDENTILELLDENFRLKEELFKYKHKKGDKYDNL